MNEAMTIFYKQFHKDCFAVLEERPEKYMFGCNNYGEITNTLNKADNDPYDIIVPGYDKLPINEKLKLKRIEGIILMPHGNHKIIVDIHTDLKRKSIKDIKDEIYLYRKLYNRLCKKYGQVYLFYY